MAWKGWQDYVPPGEQPVAAPQKRSAPGAPRRSKYNAKRCLVTDYGQVLDADEVSGLKLRGMAEPPGLWFDSRREAARWLHLQAQLKLGRISNLRRQVPVELNVVTPEGKVVTVGRWKCDFVYEENGETVHDECKGFYTPLARWKLKHAAIQMGCTIRMS